MNLKYLPYRLHGISWVHPPTFLTFDTLAHIPFGTTYTASRLDFPLLRPLPAKQYEHLKQENQAFKTRITRTAYNVTHVLAGWR